MDTKRFESPSRVMGSMCSAAVAKSKVFVCGAGGIGCELLKCLVMSGFSDIEVMDMDTVDSSNLNRQFLFRSEHVSKPKAVVAAESAKRYNPSAKIISHYGNVKDQKYDDEFFSKFDIILNGLDNRSARSHVNRMAMKSNIPLIESGTMGFNGQVQPIAKNVTQCYDCNPRQTEQISFAVCTIHQKPSSMVHCTHYAKEFYKRFFGEDVDTDPEMEYLTSLVTSGDPEGWIKRVFNACFSEKIIELTSMKDGNWSTGSAPRPATYDFCLECDATTTTENTTIESQKLLSVSDLAQLFSKTFISLHQREQSEGKIPWDKDDSLAMGLTVAIANLRAWNFHIPLKSEFDIKSISGSIIPAIATSNAIISGGIVLEALKILKNKSISENNNTEMSYSNSRVQSLRRYPARIKRKDCYIVPEMPPALNPKCYVCQSARNVMHWEANLESTTVGILIKSICSHELAMSHPMISIVTNSGDEKLIHEDEELESNVTKPLSTWIPQGAANYKILLEDMLQELEVEIHLQHNGSLDPADYKLTGEKAVLKETSAPEDKTTTAEGSDDDEGVVLYHPRKQKGKETEAGDLKRSKHN